MSTTIFQGGAPTGSGSSIITGLPNEAQPIGVASPAALVGTDLVLDVGPGIGTLYLQTESATDNTIAELTPGTEGQRLLIQAITIGGAGIIKFQSEQGSRGQIIDPRQVSHPLGIAFELATPGDCAFLTYSVDGVDGGPVGWYVNQVTNLA